MQIGTRRNGTVGANDYYWRDAGIVAGLHRETRRTSGDAGKLVNVVEASHAAVAFTRPTRRFKDRLLAV